MPLRVLITDTVTGHTFAIQAVPGGIRVQVDQALVMRPNASNSVEITAENF